MGAWESREADPVPAIETGENGERRVTAHSLGTTPPPTHFAKML